MKSFNLNTDNKNQFVDITESVKSYVKDEKVDDGVVLIYIPHTTAGVTINEGADVAVKKDVQAKLVDLAPENDGYTHLEGNSDGHIKATLTGSSVVIPVLSGSLVLGAWQAIFFCEFDGPRRRKYFIASAK